MNKELETIKKYLKENYGKKCRTFALGCIECQVWRAYEDLKEAIHLAKVIEENE